MLLLLKLIWENLREFDEKYRDRRSENFCFVKPIHLCGAVLAYYMFIKHLGPKLMENRKPFELKYVLLVYNAAQVLINSILLILGCFTVVYYKPYERLTCMMPVMLRTDAGMAELNFSYAYYLLKYLDFADTVFFVLRKRYNQVSFLHVYHHIMMSVSIFVFLRYLPGGHGAVLGFLNLNVHTIMYFYYFISALRPELKQSIWWKKHITQAQILQFLLLLLHFTRALFDAECEYPKMAILFAVIQAVVMLALFSDFYYKTYIRKSNKRLVTQINGKESCSKMGENLKAMDLGATEIKPCKF
ncbi:elongation of very long chain fatty acids protein F-like [Anastrepha ludens]|uniref:elongation of very long chain fatty acids protein F-like n=1 Tax=Anastrepha ludens TaxID=28586 RepID=UPI0023B00DAE|nr:elongation of very long chain fatty acids protein F-like [Anastrepha ludens]